MVGAVQREPSYFMLDDPQAQARDLLEVRGPDAQRFLQGLLSADLKVLPPGGARPAALLTVKGKIVSEAIALRRRDGGLVLAVPRDVATSVREELEHHVIMDDVSLSVTSEVLALVWPEWADQAPGVEGFATEHPAPGTLVLGEAAAVAAALTGIRRADARDFERYRVASGAPAWRREIVEGAFPPEVGFVAAVSYDKGCFRGQEPLARIHARGQVNWVMVRVRAAAAPAEITPLVSDGRPDAGRWTSWTDGDDGEVVGLAIVHRSVAVPGVALRAGEIAVEVTSGPLGDDLGVKGHR